ncbi:hypothetical protein POCGH01_00029200 [Plasmodium ovale]|uniref:Uncharacterized protein n=2 Tax=Plasmodium ovale TaxID=36330 RepID=A0A1A8X9B0_PLAOA|nr:hypothetical protein POVCU2_0060260 [Plasmodium ovale curtisi]SBT01834.1 hypothetical protein POVCU1_069970 [Plasmodium ovale curtisi]SBT83641.1 hypothetical protein POCGH01_00029200 [Plasmodium ovale]
MSIFLQKCKNHHKKYILPQLQSKKKVSAQKKFEEDTAQRNRKQKIEKSNEKENKVSLLEQGRSIFGMNSQLGLINGAEFIAPHKLRNK